MFVKNKEKIDFKYRKGSYLAVLKAMTVSYVDESKVSAKELIDCYGQRIDIISRDVAAQVAPQVTKEVKAEVKKAEPTKKVSNKKVETVRISDLNDSFIQQILGEIKEETKKTEVCEHKDACKGDCEHKETCEHKGTCENCTKKEEVKAPEAPKTTEVKTPEVKAPEAPKTTEVKTPEVKAPEVKAPEVKAPEAPKATKTTKTKSTKTRTVGNRASKAKSKAKNA